MQPFLQGERDGDRNNFGPRIGFNWATRDGRTSVTAATASTTTASRWRSSRSSAASTGGRCRSRCGPATCSSSIRQPASSRRSRRRRRTRSPGSSSRAPAPVASTSSTTRCRTRRCSSSTSASSGSSASRWCVRANGVHDHGTHFIIGRTIGEVFNPVVGGPDRVVNLESSVSTNYDALLLSAERRDCAQQSSRRLHARQGAQLRQRRSDPVLRTGRSIRTTCGASTGRRPTTSATASRLPASWHAAGPVPGLADLDARLGRADGHPDARRAVAHSRLPAQRRRAAVQERGRAQRVHPRPERGRRRRRRAAAAGERRARGSATRSTASTRGSRAGRSARTARIEGIVEVFNVFNVTNVLGVSNTNYSGFSNVLVRDSDEPGDPGYLRPRRSDGP